MVQISLRRDEVAYILDELCYNSVMSLLGLSMNPHTQTLGKPAQLLQSLLQETPAQPKGRGKGKTKSTKGVGKSQKSTQASQGGS